MAALLGWLSEQYRTYVGNAGSIREMRSAMRGWNTPVVLFCYLGFLLLVTVLFYTAAAQGGVMSVTRVQESLNTLAMVVLGTTALLVGLIAPSLVCTSLVGEYQRKSIDLVFSAPVTTKYFLIGKLLSAYRYIVLLVFMTLPILSIGVVLGGITPKWVFVTLFLSSLHGLLFAAVSLPIAAVTGRVVQAAGYSFVACFAVALQPLFLQIPTLGPGGGQPGFLAAMTPFMVYVAADGTTPVFGLDVPSWIVGSAALLFLVRVFVVGAGSALSQAGSADTVSLRVHCLVLAAVFALGTGLSGSTTLPFPGGTSFTATAVFYALLYLVVALPFLAVWSYAAPAKGYPNGVFSLRLLLRGTPASGLPFLLLLMALITAGIVGPAWYRDPSSAAADAPYVFGSWAILLLGWSFGWFGSVLGGAGGIGGSRRILLAFLAGFAIVPGVVLGWISSLTNDPDVMVRYNPLFLLASPPEEAWAKGAAMLALAVILGVVGEISRRSMVVKVHRVAA